MERVSTSRNTQILGLLAIAQLMGVLDFSIVNVALPSIQRMFHLAAADLQWVVSAYALVFGGFLLLGLGLFSLASLAGGLAPSSLVILLARAVQGLGGAIVSPTALALLTTTFPEGPRRNRALGVFGSVSGLGFALGVILGGVLTSLLSWRWVFFVNVPVGLLVLLGAFFLLPSSRAPATRAPLDLAGAILFTGAMVSLVLALSQGAAPTASLTQVLLPGILAVVCGVVFLMVERRSQHPLVPLGVFRNLNLSVANLMALLTIAIASLLAFILTLYLQSVLLFSPLATGLAFLPAGVGGMAGGQIAIRAMRGLGVRSASALGPALIALGSVLLTRIIPSGGAAWVVVGYLIAGAGTARIGRRATEYLAAGRRGTWHQPGKCGCHLDCASRRRQSGGGGHDRVPGDAVPGAWAGVITAVLAMLALRTRTPVDTRTSLASEEKQETLSLLLRSRD